jgi:molybdate transport system regulatory protein
MNGLKSKAWGVRSKVWIELDGKPILGEGRMRILRAIERHGSMREAANATGVSYRRLRGAIHDMEKTVGSPLVRSFRGGDMGGGAALLPAAHELMDYYEKVVRGFHEAMDTRFAEIFR